MDLSQRHLIFFFWRIFKSGRRSPHTLTHGYNVSFRGFLHFLSFFFHCFFILVLDILRISFHRIASEIATILTTPPTASDSGVGRFFWSTRGRNMCSVTRSEGETIAHWHSKYLHPIYPPLIPYAEFFGFVDQQSPRSPIFGTRRRGICVHVRRC